MVRSDGQHELAGKRRASERGRAEQYWGSKKTVLGRDSFSVAGRLAGIEAVSGDPPHKTAKKKNRDPETRPIVTELLWPAHSTKVTWPYRAAQ